MKTEQIKQIKMSTGKRPKARFNLSHDVNTSMSWGDMQPLMCRLMTPGTKNVLSIDSLVRLAPLVSPTFGRIKYKTYHQFVDMEDIMPAFGNFMAQSPAWYNNNQYTPPKVFSLPVCVLSAMCLTGCKMNVLRSVGSGTDSWDNYKISDESSSLPSTISTALTSFLQAFLDTTTTTPTWTSALPGYEGYVFPLKTLFDMTGVNSALNSRYGSSAEVTNSPYNYIPMANKTFQSFLTLTDPGFQGDFSTRNITPENADFMLKISYGGEDWLLCFGLSSFGKRLRKVLLGCGYQLDLYNTDMVNVLPLLATYKAYWDLFGLTKFIAWEQTSCYYLIQNMTFNRNYGVDFLSALFGSGLSVTIGRQKWTFFSDLGNLWYTELPDFVGAHTSDLSSGPKSEGLDFIDTTSITADAKYAISSDSGETSGSVSTVYTSNRPSLPVAGRSNISGVISIGSLSGNSLTGFLSGLTIDSLMRLYRWTNKNSVAGMEIANLLKAQGYGYFVYSCKSSFIGYTEDYVTISDVVSTADTSNSNGGAYLGEYGGRGLSYNESKSFDYETDSFGYWVTLAGIVPESGYCQGIDPSLYALDKFDFYNPEFDGLGMEITPLPVIAGDCPVHLETGVPTSTKGFGFIPRYSGLKIAHNINNGDYSLRSTKYLKTFELDKDIPLGEPYIAISVPGTSVERYNILSLLNQNNIPTAGEIWRYVTKYPWLGRFDRIFAAANEQNWQDRLIGLFYNNTSGLESSAYLVIDYDNFNVHNVFNMQSYAPMLPIESSFGTDSETGSFDGAMDKT